MLVEQPVGGLCLPAVVPCPCYSQRLSQACELAQVVGCGGVRTCGPGGHAIESG